MKLQYFTRTLLLLILLGWHPLFAQENHEADPDMSYSVGYAGFMGQERLISIKVDSGKTKIYANNFLNGSGITNTNFVYLEGAQQIEISTSVQPRFYDNYRYRIILNDTMEIRHWQEPNLETAFNFFKDVSVHVRDSFIEDIIENHPGSLSTRLATVDCVNKKITVQMYNINRPNDVSTVYIYNKSLKRPQISQGMMIFQRSDNGPREYSYISFDKQSDENSISIDSLHDLKLLMTENDAKLIYQVFVKRTDKKGEISYPVPTDWIHKYGMEWKNQQLCYSNIPNSYFKEPGDYEITVMPQLSGQGLKNLFEDKATTVGFTVLKSKEKLFTLGQIMSYIGAFAIVSGLTFWQYKRVQNKKLANEVWQKEKTKIQLESVRSQLNPHFMFNALAGIQNLMNKSDIDTANRYLGKFARLTRNVLESTDRDLISIADEKSLLEDYLQMEQLRFGFQYRIHSEEDLNEVNLEVPAMLLQPFVENAIKHGISDMKSNGVVKVDFKKEQNDLLLTVSDNGKGFDLHKEYDGFGLKLSRNRITLLNEMYKETPIELKIDSGLSGTVISINLHNWI